MWLLLLAVLLLSIALAGGGWDYTRYGYWSMSPATIILVVVVALFFTGHLSWNQ